MASKFQGMLLGDTGGLVLPVGDASNRTSNTPTVTQFTSTGTTSWTAPAGVDRVDVLVVGGGGGGGSGLAAGGGGGGVVYRAGYPVVPGASYTVTVGGGGAGGANDSNSPGSNGGQSVFDSIVALGGGAGSMENGTNGGGGRGTVASGGGVTTTGTPTESICLQGTEGQGFRGGCGFQSSTYSYPQGSGGGAGGPATLAKNNAGRKSEPGPGVANDITGSVKYYGGGGGGAGYGDQTGTGQGGADGAIGGGGDGGTSGASSTNKRLASDGAANTGGGGGGGPEGVDVGNQAGGNGGSGIVILRYIRDSESDDPNGQIRFNSSLRQFEITANNRTSQPNINKNIVKDNSLIFYIDAKNFSGSGTQIQDLSGRDNNPIFAASGGSVNYTWNRDIGYWDIDTNTYIYKGGGVDGLDNLSESTGYTKEVWFFNDSHSAYDGIMVFVDGDNYGNNSDASIARFMVHQTNSVIFYDVFGADQAMDDPFNFQTGVWYHAVLTVDLQRDIVKCYINGRCVDTSKNGIPGSFPNCNTIFVGTGESGGSHQSDCKIGAARAYTRALSDQEVAKNYEADRERFVGKSLASTNYILPAVVTDGLKLWYDTDNPQCYIDCGQEFATLSDLSGNGNHAEIIGNPFFESERRVFQFDAVDDYFLTRYKPTIDNSQITWELWFRKGSTPAVAGDFASNNALISNYGSTSTTPYLQMHLQDGGEVRWSERNSSNVEFQVTSGNICNNKWRHICGVAYEDRLELYVDGVYQGKANRPEGVTTSGQYLHLGSNHLGRYHSGEYKEFRCYEKALTGSEVLQNYEATKGKYGVQ